MKCIGRWCLGLVLLCEAFAQSSSVRIPIERALQQVSMRWSDLTLPSDLSPRDPYRLEMVERVFTDPLALVEYGVRLGNLGDSACTGATGHALERLLREAGHRTINLSLPSAQWGYYPADASSEQLLRTSLVYQSIVQQYLYPIAAFLQATERVRRFLRTDPVLFPHSDTLWLLSKEDEEADPYQIKAAELRADSIARLFFDRARATDVSTLLSYAVSLYAQIADRLRRTQQAWELLRDSIRTIVWDTPFGRCAIGGPYDDVYRGDFLFIFDVGGNDTYHLESSKQRAFERGVHIVIDLAGNDLYLGSDYTLGAGVAGCGILYDRSGDDLYRAGNFSLGAGLWGFGILRDEAGNDTYIGAVCSQAAAVFGVGLLWDGEGNDHYTVSAHGQAFAGTQAVAILLDEGGNDIYTTSSPFVDVLRYDAHYLAFTQGAALGYRPIASGGIALLRDRKGNDVYTSDIYGQGTAYWFGIGILDDHDGEDRYIAYQYAQGAGIHFAHGMLWDHSGNDLYFARGVSQGCGHDVGVGFLLDEKGDDAYSVESLSLGGGNANALSIFVDRQGDDAYITRNDGNTRGFSDLRRGLPMLGVFVDASGNDRYALPLGNDVTTYKATFGITFDGVDTATVAQATSEQKPMLQLPTSLDSLFVLASTAPQKYQHYVAPARAAIVERGVAALPLVAARLGTPFPRERLALEDIIPRLYQRDSAAVIALVRDSLHSPRTATVLMCLWSIGKCRIAVLADSLRVFFRHSDWRIRAAAAQQAGEGKFRTLSAVLVQLLQDSHSWVRARAAYALAALEGAGARDLIVRLLRDTAAIVRTSAVLGLRESNAWTPATVAELLRNCPTDAGRRSIALCMTMLDSTQQDFPAQWQQLERAIIALPPPLRLQCYRALCGSKFRCRLEAMLKLEPDATIAAEMRRFLATVSCPPVQETLPTLPERRRR
ncbi:MAG: HEAT repeat domain-containing protein [Bacteroidota bacterium]|nr:HEAT repeat domain-containing protein [Bacteroidota bacterium]